MTGFKIWLRAIKARRVVPRTIVVRPREINLDVRLFCFIEIYKPLIEYEALEKEGGGGGGETSPKRSSLPRKQTKGCNYEQNTLLRSPDRIGDRARSDGVRLGADEERHGRRGVH